MMLNNTAKQHFPLERQCRFCEHLSQNDESNILNRAWHGTKDYSAIVSIGALVPGWSLICPTIHKTNLTEDYAKIDFWNFATTVQKRLFDEYQKPIHFFEHGPLVTGSTTGCGIDHAHLHAVPLDFSLEEATYRYDPKIKWQKCRVSDINELHGKEEYLFFATHIDGINTIGNLAILNKEISQFFRRVIAQELGIPEHYDYKKNPMLRTATDTAELLHRSSHYYGATSKIHLA